MPTLHRCVREEALKFAKEAPGAGTRRVNPTPIIYPSVWLPPRIDQSNNRVTKQRSSTPSKASQALVDPKQVYLNERHKTNGCELNSM